MQAATASIARPRASFAAWARMGRLSSGVAVSGLVVIVVNGVIFSGFVGEEASLKNCFLVVKGMGKLYFQGH